MNTHAPTPFDSLKEALKPDNMPIVKCTINMNYLEERLSENGWGIAEAKQIVHAIDSQKALLEAAKFAFENLKPKGNVRKDFSGHNAMATLSKAIWQAENKI